MSQLTIQKVYRVMTRISSRGPDWSFLDWNGIDAQPLSACRWSPNPPPRATVQVVWIANEGLCIRMESFAVPTRVVHQAQNAPVWEDDCLEAFLSFDGKHYIHLAANPNGILYGSFGLNADKQVPLSELGLPLPNTEVKRGAEGWSVVLFIPDVGAQILYGAVPGRGTVIHGNFCARGEQTALPYYASWSPIPTQTPDFHRSEWFGNLIIE